MFIEDWDRIGDLSSAVDGELAFVAWEESPKVSMYLKTLYFANTQGQLMRYRVTPVFKYTGYEVGGAEGEMFRYDSSGQVAEYRLHPETHNRVFEPDFGWDVKWVRLGEGEEYLGEVFSVSINHSPEVFYENLLNMGFAESVAEHFLQLANEFPQYRKLFSWKTGETFGYYIDVGREIGEQTA